MATVDDDFSFESFLKDEMQIDARADLSTVLMLFERSTLEVRQEIVDVISTRLTPNDQPGHLYGYTRPSDRNLRRNFFIKIGRTKHVDPDKRVGEWVGDTSFTIETRLNVRAERLMQAFFMANNIERGRHVEWYKFEGITRQQLATWVSSIVDLVEELYFEADDATAQPAMEAQPENPLLDINTATVAQLQSAKLPGIGRKKAQAIVAYRQKNGKFLSKQDIMRVRGIKGGLYNKIESLIQVTA